MEKNTLIVAIVSGALCFAIGFAGGALLTMPNRATNKASIGAVEAKANEAQAIAQEKLQTNEAEITRLRSELKRVATELKQAKDNLAAEAKAEATRLQQERQEKTDSGSSSGSSKSGGSSSQSSSVDLNASVVFTGTQFVIQNKDTFDWTDVKLEVNPRTFSSGYILKVSRIESGRIYTVETMQFAKPDGERFNPFTHKPQNLSIWCDTPRGKGFYYGGWE